MAITKKHAVALLAQIIEVNTGVEHVLCKRLAERIYKELRDLDLEITPKA